MQLIGSRIVKRIVVTVIGAGMAAVVGITGLSAAAAGHDRGTAPVGTTATRADSSTVPVTTPAPAATTDVESWN